MGDARQLYGVALSLVFYLAGIFFFAWYVHNKLPVSAACLVLLSVLFQELILQTAIRPLTDSIFFGCLLFLVWFTDRYPGRLFWAGCIAGCMIFLRTPAVLALPFLPLLVVRELKPRPLFTALLWIVAGCLPWLLLQYGLKLHYVGEASVTQKGFYLTHWTHVIQETHILEYIRNAKRSVEYLFAPYILYFLGFFFIASFFFKKYPYYYLTLFTGGYLLLLISIFSTLKPLVHRYFFPVLPLMLFIAYTIAIYCSKYCINSVKEKHTKSLYVLFIFYIFTHFPPVFFNIQHMSHENIALFNYDKIEEYLQFVQKDDILVSNAPREIFLLADSRRIFRVPPDSETFLQDVHADKAEALVFLLDRSRDNLGIRSPGSFKESKDIAVYNHGNLSGWNTALTQNELVTATGQRFEKSWEEKNRLLWMIVYRAVQE